MKEGINECMNDGMNEWRKEGSKEGRTNESKERMNIYIEQRGWYCMEILRFFWVTSS